MSANGQSKVSRYMTLEFKMQLSMLSVLVGNHVSGAKHLRLVMCLYLQAPKHPIVTSEEMMRSFVSEPKLW